jgi:hypothetical protein
MTKEDEKKITCIEGKLFFKNNSYKLKNASFNQPDELAVLLKNKKPLILKLKVIQTLKEHTIKI